MIEPSGDPTRQRRDADDALRDSERRFRLLVEQLPATVLITDANEGSRVLYISPHHERLVGYPVARYMADPYFWRETLHPDDRDRVLREAGRTDATGEAYSDEYRVITADGRVIWVHEHTELVRDEDGVPRCWQGVIFDVTDRKQAEEELRRAQARARELLEREQEATRTLRALDQMKTTFLEAVSHDLRTPLTTILGAALTLANPEVRLSDHDAGDLLARLVDNARKLDRLLSDLLDLDRLSRGILEPQRLPIDVAAAVRATVEECAGLVGDRPVHAPIGASVPGFVEPAKLERIVENLLANAARHTPPGTPIWVRVERDGDGVLIAVEDAGPGVPQELRDAVFDPFRQAGPAGPSPGVGIGLTLVHRFAELHGGRAWVQERPGGGASFRVRLPDGPAQPA